MGRLVKLDFGHDEPGILDARQQRREVTSARSGKNRSGTRSNGQIMPGRIEH
jgi:hypothetical protein